MCLLPYPSMELIFENAWNKEEGRGLAIHPMPYVLQFESQPGEAGTRRMKGSEPPVSW